MLNIAKKKKKKKKKGWETLWDSVKFTWDSTFVDALGPRDRIDIKPKFNTGYREAGFYRRQYLASYTHKSLGRTPKFTLPASVGTQMCLLCLSLKSQIQKLFPNDSF